MALYRKKNLYVVSLIHKWFVPLLFFQLLTFPCFTVATEVIHQKGANSSQLSNEELLNQAKAGNASVQYLLSRKLLGLGGTRDSQKGLQWLHQAADGGNPEAQYDLVISYEHITHIMRDNPARGVAYLQSAADKNHLRAMAALTEAIEKGHYGLTQDYQKAQNGYRKMLQTYESGKYEGKVDEQFIKTQRRQLEFVTNVLNYNKGKLQRLKKATLLDRQIIEIDNLYRLQYQQAAKALDHGDTSPEGRKRFRAEVNRLRQLYIERREVEIGKLKGEPTDSRQTTGRN